MTEVDMKIILRTLFASIAAFAALCSSAADGIAFITNLKGEVAVDGEPRPMLMSELAKGQRIVAGKDAQLAVMYIQSGKEYVLKGPDEFTVGERGMVAQSGMPTAMRETAWRPGSQVLVQVAKSSAASIRMRSFAPAKAANKPKLEFPIQGAVSTLQPTLRWIAPGAKASFEVVVAAVGKEDKPIAKSRANATSHRLPSALQPDSEYTWTVSIADKEIGSAKFRTLPAAAIQDLDRRKPGEKSEFSDRLLYALLLQELGAIQEAQEAWGKLAQERTDLPELAGLAK